MWQIIINGPGYFDTPYELPEGITHVGRADENDIVLSGDLVSRRHVRFQLTAGQLQVEDLGSRNGSKVNGEAFRGFAPLRPGDTVQVGENTVVIRQPSPSQPDPTVMVDLGAGGVKRFGRGADLGSSLVISRDLRESVVLRALDNVVPFQRTTVPLGDVPRQVPYEWLVTLYRTAELLSSAGSLQELLDQTADRVMERVDATTAVILLRHQSGMMVPAAVRHRGELTQGEVPVSDAIIDAALQQGAALAVADVRGDERFAQRESVILYGAEQVLCIPIRAGAEFIGVIYLNRPGGDPQELEPLLDLGTAVANLISTGVRRFRSESDPAQEQVRRSLERFFPPEVVERRLAESRSAPLAPARLEERTVTVLVADLSGFTQVVQRAGPEKVLEILNDFYQRMTGVVFSFDGTVDKFIGDAVVALFGAPYGKGDEALRAVRCSLALRAEWDRQCTRYPPELRCPLRLALHTGGVLVGMVGTQVRQDYTALGEPVNLTSWLCASAQPGQVLITGKTLAQVGARFDVTPLGERVLRGAKDKVAVFEVVEEDVGHLTRPGLT